MNKLYVVLFLSFFTIGNLNAQFGYSVLNKEQSSEAFIPLKFHTVNDSTGTGYGFPNPTDLKSIVISKEKPTGENIKDWTVLKVKYAEFYNERLLNKLQKILEKRNISDSLKSDAYLKSKLPLVDTLKIHYLRKMKGNLGNGLKLLVYENSQVRLFQGIPSNHYVTPKLIFFQTKEYPAYDSDTYFLNYHNHKAFKRSAKRVFKECPELLGRIQKGDYFSNDSNTQKLLADDYKSTCISKK
ncbi:MAG: hypothetical protein HKP06_11745 [Flavobacteriaceae bacterium]|nr:hypothetical protein [Flavobacteriaceae bacterium]